MDLDLDDFAVKDYSDDENDAMFGADGQLIEEAMEVATRRGQGTSNMEDDGSDADAPADERVLAGMKKAAKKRVLRPQPKLDEQRLCSENGLAALPKIFKNWKPDPRKDEYANLNKMMDKMEHWAHCLYPKLKFDDFLARAESLGDKRAVKTYITKIRLDMPLTDEDFAQNADDNKEGANDEDVVMVSRSSLSPLPPQQSLPSSHTVLPAPLSTQPQSQEVSLEASREDNYDPFLDVYEQEDDYEQSAPVVVQKKPVASPVKKTQITDEQKKRMDENRRRAMEIRQKRLAFFDNQNASMSIPDDSAPDDDPISNVPPPTTDLGEQEQQKENEKGAEVIGETLGEDEAMEELLFD